MWNRNTVDYSLYVNIVRLFSTEGTHTESISRRNIQLLELTTFYPPDLEQVISAKVAKMESPEGASVWGCLECFYQSPNRHNVMSHVEVHHVKHSGHKCHLCQNTCPTKNALRMHYKRKHSEMNNPDCVF